MRHWSRFLLIENLLANLFAVLITPFTKLHGNYEKTYDAKFTTKNLNPLFWKHTLLTYNITVVYPPVSRCSPTSFLFPVFVTAGIKILKRRFSQEVFAVFNRFKKLFDSYLVAEKFLLNGEISRSTFPLFKKFNLHTTSPFGIRLWKIHTRKIVLQDHFSFYPFTRSTTSTSLGNIAKVRLPRTIFKSEHSSSNESFLFRTQLNLL